MSVHLVSAPVYRIECDRLHCKHSFCPVDSYSGDPQLVRGRALRVGWDLDLDGLDLCPSHARPAVRRGLTVIAAREDAGAWRAGSWYECRARNCRGKGCIEVKRTHGDGFRWWAYCAEHAYGRWVDRGQIWRWEIRAVGEAVA